MSTGGLIGCRAVSRALARFTVAIVRSRHVQGFVTRYPQVVALFLLSYVALLVTVGYSMLSSSGTLQHQASGGEQLKMVSATASNLGGNLRGGLG